MTDFQPVTYKSDWWSRYYIGDHQIRNGDEIELSHPDGSIERVTISLFTEEHKGHGGMSESYSYDRATYSTEVRGGVLEVKLGVGQSARLIKAAPLPEKKKVEFKRRYSGYGFIV